jgi:hypothetical protein
MPGSFLCLERRRVRQVGCRLVVEFNHLRKIEGRLIHHLILAKAVIRGVQVGKIDAMEGLGVGTESRRVVERC